MAEARERAAAREEEAEIHQIIADVDDRFARLSFNAETEPMREKMAQLLNEMHRMEENLQRLAQLKEDKEIKGGTENGND